MPVQRVYVVGVEPGAAPATPDLPSSAQWRRSDGVDSGTQPPVEVLRGLSGARAGESKDQLSQRLDDTVRSFVWDHRRSDVVLMVPPEVAGVLVTQLSGTPSGPVRGVTVIGLPRTPQVVGPGIVAGIAFALAVVDFVLWGAYDLPFLASLAVVPVALVLAVSERTRPWTWALAKAVAIALVITVLVVASSKRFPTYS